MCGTRYNSLPERLLQECDFTLFKAISAGHATEEISKHVHKILKSQPTIDIDKIFIKKVEKSSHNTRNQNTKDFIKNCKFWDSLQLNSHTMLYFLFNVKRQGVAKPVEFSFK